MSAPAASSARVSSGPVVTPTAIADASSADSDVGDGVADVDARGVLDQRVALLVAVHVTDDRVDLEADRRRGTGTRALPTSR